MHKKLQSLKKSGNIQDLFKPVFPAIMVLLLSCFVSINVYGQQTGIRVSGKVTDTSGESLVGVSIKIKNTTSGTITDINGNSGTNSTNLIIAHNYFDIPLELLTDIKAHPNEYDFKYEVFVKDTLPITNTNARVALWLGQRPNDYANKEWRPAGSGAAYHTNNKWQTISLDIKYFMSPTDTQVMLQETHNLFIVAFINPGLGVPTDISFANFRIAKNINIARKQL